MKKLQIILLLFPLLAAAQTSPQKTSGEAFKAYASTPGEDIRETTIKVTKSLNGLRFADRQISEVYKKAIEKFFKEAFNGYSSEGNYKLKVKQKYGRIYVENRNIMPIDGL
jgi:hypothetical protein